MDRKETSLCKLISDSSSRLLFQNDLSYEDILLMRAPLSASQINPDEDVRLENNAAVNNMSQSQPAKVLYPGSKAKTYHRLQKSREKQRGTHWINKKLRADMKRQCTMPSYVVIKEGMGENSAKNANVDETTTNTQKVSRRPRNANKGNLINKGYLIILIVTRNTDPNISNVDTVT